LLYRTISAGGSGGSPTISDYTNAFTLALGCNVALLGLGGRLSLWLPGWAKGAAPVDLVAEVE
jgi:hypothetical protein